MIHLDDELLDIQNSNTPISQNWKLLREFTTVIGKEKYILRTAICSPRQKNPLKLILKNQEAPRQSQTVCTQKFCQNHSTNQI